MLTRLLRAVGYAPVEHPPLLAVPRSPHWPAVRARHLSLFPTCAACGGKEDVQVHHVLPFHLHKELELDSGNLISLCEAPGRSCHHAQGHLFDWSSWNANVRADAAAMLQKVLTRPKG